MNLPYFALLKFLLVAALINIFLFTFRSQKILLQILCHPKSIHRGYDGCPSHHRFPQAKLIFPLNLPKKNINPFPLHDLPGIPTFFSYSFSTFLTDVSSSSFSPPPETSGRAFPWFFRLYRTRFTDFLVTEQFITFFSGTHVSAFFS